MGITREEIIIGIQAISKGINRTFGRLQKEMAGMTHITGLNNQQFREYGTLSGGVNKRMKGMNTTLGRVSASMRHGTAGFRGFRMEMLGVMFFGMGMSKIFSDMLKPAGKMFGLFELWTTTLQVAFLPLMETLAPLLITFMLWMMDLDPATQKAIGWFVLFSAILFKVMFAVGMLTLGLGSLFGTSFFANIARGIAMGVRFFMGLFGLSVWVFAAILAIIIGFVVAWKEDFANMKDWVAVIWTGIKQTFKGGIDWVLGLLKIFVGIFTLNWDKIKEGFSQMWTGMKGVAGGMVKIIIGLVVSIGVAVLRVIVGIINAGIRLINKIPGIDINTIKTKSARGFEKEIKKDADVVVNQDITVTSSNKEDVMQLIDDNNKRLNDELARHTTT